MSNLKQSLVSKLRLVLLIALTILCVSTVTQASAKSVVMLDIDGAIGPATSDYVLRGIQHAQSQDALAIILRMDTPGGLDGAMRKIIKAILASSVPVISYVSPSGSRAASAGTYILYASHVAVMAPATTLGSATPIQIGGGGLPGMPDEEQKPASTKDKDQRDNQEDNESAESENAEQAQGDESSAPKTAMERKIVNDAAAYIRGLANRHGRNADWAERAVREAVSLSASEAREISVIDLIAADTDDLLQQLNGWAVTVNGDEITLNTEDYDLVQIQPDWRNKLLTVITDPNIAYILMLVGIYGLLFELMNPGAVVPGVLGAISLLLALYAFQVLPINYAGLGLIILGIIFMIAEVFAPSFGILGFGGIAAFVAGSVILLDDENLSVSLPVVGGIALISAGFFLWVITRFLKLRTNKPITGAEQMLGMTGTALESFESSGRVRVHGEVWQASSAEPVEAGQTIEVVSMNGLKLTIKSVQEQS